MARLQRRSTTGTLTPVIADDPSAPRRLLAWVLGTPFFLLPVPLTVDAPDIFGGYSIHLRQGLALAALGLVLGVLDVWGARIAERLRKLAPAGWAVGLLLLAVGLAFLASLVGAHVLRLLRLAPMLVQRGTLPVAVAPVTAIAFLVTFARLALGATAGGVPRLLGLPALVFLAGVGHDLALRRGGGLPWLPLLAALLALAWPWLRSRGPWLDRLALVPLALSLAGVFGALALWCTATLAVRIPDQRVIGLCVAAATVATVGVLLRLRFAGAFEGAGRPVVARRLVWLARRVPWLLGLLVAGRIAITLAAVAGGLIVELFGWLEAASTRRWLDPAPPHAVEVAWMVLLLSIGLAARTREAVLRLGAAASFGWVLLVALRVGLLLTVGDAALAIEWSGAGVLLVMTPVLARLPRRALPLLLSTGGAVVGALAVRYGLAILALPRAPGVALGVGALVAVGIVLLARRLDDGPIDVRRLAVRLPLLGVALVLPIYMVVFAGIRPIGFGLAALAVLGASVALDALVAAPWLLFYVSFVAVAVFKAGPDAAECSALVASTEARLLVDRWGDGDYDGVYPYDAVPLPDRDAVVASFKRIDHGGGFVETVALADPARRQRTAVRRDGPLWPERLVADPETGRLWVQVIGVGAHGMWELVPSGEGVAVGRKLDLPYEPGNPALDAERRRMALTYVPNREGGNPVVEVFDIDSGRSLGRAQGTNRRMQMADFVATDEGTGAHYAPTLFDFVRFGIIEVDPELGLSRHLETFHPVIGLAADPGARRLYLTNPLGGTMEVLDLDTWEVVQTVRVGLFPRDVAYDRQRGLLHVANYGDGDVVTFSTEGGVLDERRRVPVGGLLRGVGVDPTTGVVVAASGCGVFEVR